MKVLPRNVTFPSGRICVIPPETPEPVLGFMAFLERAGPAKPEDIADAAVSTGATFHPWEMNDLMRALVMDGFVTLDKAHRGEFEAIRLSPDGEMALKVIREMQAESLMASLEATPSEEKPDDR